MNEEIMKRDAERVKKMNEEIELRAQREKEE